MPTLIQALDQLICHGREEIWHTDRAQALDQCPQKVDQCPQKEGVCQRVSTRTPKEPCGGQLIPYVQITFEKDWA